VEWANEGNDDSIRSNREFAKNLKTHSSIVYKRQSDKRRYLGLRLKPLDA
jgi:hypothetical protein